MPELATLCADFLSALDLERNYSPYTLRSYRHNLEQFRSWLIEQGRTGTPSDLAGLAIRDFLGYLRDHCHNDARTVAHKLATLKSFLGYLRETLPPAQASALPKVTWHYKYDKKVQQSLRDEDLNALLDAVHERIASTEADLQIARGRTRRLRKQLAACRRDLLLLLLMAGAGLRVGEVCGLNLDDVDLADHSIRVRGKGRKIRVVYFDIPEMVEAMAQYLRERCVLGSDPTALFLNGRDGGRISSRAIQLLLKSYLRDAGLDSKTSPHTLRHTFSTLSIERGANVKAVSQILGHAHVSTTLALYTHLSTEHVRQVFRLFHPRNPERLPLEEVVAHRRHALMFVKDQTNQSYRAGLAAAGG